MQKLTCIICPMSEHVLKTQIRRHTEVTSARNQTARKEVTPGNKDTFGVSLNIRNGYQF